MCLKVAVRVIALALALTPLLAPLAVNAQRSAKVPRIGVVAGGFPGADPCLEALRRGLQETGYVDGQTHVLEPRWAEGRAERFPRLAAELVRLQVDLMVSVAAPAAVAVKEATTSIPIVLASSFYPVELGVIASLARPGGNVTGVTHFTPELMAKRVQMLTELVPGAARFAVLRLAGRDQDLVVRDMETAAQKLDVKLQVIEVGSVEGLSAAFDAAHKGGAQGVMTTQAPFFLQNNATIAQLALAHRLPSISGEPNAAEAGVLLFYGPSIIEGCQRAAYYVDRLLKGAKPADLPVEQPMKFKLVINLKTAQALGITIPPTLLFQADEVIR
jgi:putative ABC transport system substrate-binding protein